ncbi:hypothetical protein NMG60_11002250 [Bertholletia excelsa]
MKIPGNVIISYIILVLLCYVVGTCKAQDYEDEAAAGPPPPQWGACNGIFVQYTFTSREKAYPFVKNASAQAWTFRSQLMLLNAGMEELKAWKVYVGFQHDEILVTADGAVVVDGGNMPVHVGKKGATLAGYPMADLKTAIDTAGDFSQMQVQVALTGTMFGMKDPKAAVLPKTIRLVNDGFKCPQPTRFPNTMQLCCKKDPKLKKKTTTKFLPRQHGDLSFTYDVLKSYASNYEAQVTVENFHPLGRLDHWNLSWDWMRGEFIQSMRGAFTPKKDFSECLFGPQNQYYKDFDFTTVMNCQRRPVISDLPPDKKDDEKIGMLPGCCRNGTLLPRTMNVTKSRSAFQLTVYKLPPDMNRTALTPPQRWKIKGVVNAEYTCGPPIRVDPSPFPDPDGLATIHYAIATWQVTCNITRPKPKQAKCCVSFSAYYAKSAVPCATCACGCGDNTPGTCDRKARALPLPTAALLVPFENRTEKAKAWARIIHNDLPKKLPCPDNCGLSINWHAFEDWSAAIQMKEAFDGYEKVYSFNGTVLDKPKNTIFFQGLKGLNYLVGEVNGTKPGAPRVPGKQQSVISFTKKQTPDIKIATGGGFPSKVIFNGAECALPPELPKVNGARQTPIGLLPAIVVAAVSFLLIRDQFR